MKKAGKGIVAVLAAALTVLLCRGNVAKAAGGATMLPDSSIRVNYQNETMEVDLGSNTEIYYSESAVANNWELAPITGTKAVFDISWIKPGTTTRIYLKGDKDSVVTARYINAQESLTVQFVGDLSAADVVDIDDWKNVYKNYPTFSNETGYLLFFLKQGGVGTAYFDMTAIEWKKGDTGNWRPFAELDLAQMGAKGGVLNFRIKAVNDEDTTDKKSGKRYSSTAKLTLQKKAAAPVVNVNNASFSATIRNGMEFSLNKKDWYLIPVYDRSSTSDVISLPVVDFAILPTTNVRVASIAIPLIMNVSANTKIDDTLLTTYPSRYTAEYDDGGNPIGIRVYVRTAASSKKSASKMMTLLIPFATGTPDLANDITLEYQQGKTGTGGLILTNNTTTDTPTDYQYAIVDDPTALTAEELSLVTWSNLKASKSVKVGNSKALPGQYVIFRVASSGKDSLPSDFVAYPNPICYDKVTYAAFSSTSLYPGGVMTAVTSNNAIAGAITYRWEKSSTATGTYTKITEGTGYAASQYTIKDSDVGSYIRVVIGNTSASGEYTEVASKCSGKIAPTP